MNVSKIVKTHQEQIKDHILGIGRFSIPIYVNGEFYYPPKLHFFLYENKMPNGDRCLSAFCIETGLEQSGKTKEDAINGLIEACTVEFHELVRPYSKKNTKEMDYNKIVEKLETHNEEGYWKIYRQVNLKNSLKHAKTADQPDAYHKMIQKQGAFISELSEAYQKSHETSIKLYNENKKLNESLNRQENISLKPKKISKTESIGEFELLRIAS